MKLRSLALVTIAALGLMLTACETVKNDIRTSSLQTRALFNDFSKEKLLAATPTNIQDTQPDTKAIFADMKKDNLTRGEMQVEEHILTGDNKIIPVPSHRPDTTQTITASNDVQAPAERANPACPDVRIVGDLNQVHQFTGNRARPEESISSIRLQDITEDCKIGSKNISIDMTLAFEGKIGPKGKSRRDDKPSFAYPYFVAITNNQGNIVAKEVFAVTLSYEGDKTTNTKIEKIRQAIPVASGDMRNYKVLIGFQLNDDELAYNRTLPPDSIFSSNDAANIKPASGR